MRRLSAALLIFELAGLPAHAEESEEAVAMSCEQAAAHSVFDVFDPARGMVHAEFKAVDEAMRRNPGAALVLVRFGIFAYEHLLLREDDNRASAFGGRVAQYVRAEDRAAILELVRAPLADRKDPCFRVALKLVDAIELGPELLDTMLSFMEDLDWGIASTARDSFVGCRDPEVIRRLRERALKPNDRKNLAMDALGQTGDDAHLRWLLSVAADESLEVEVRGKALNCYPDEKLAEAIPTALEVLKSENQTLQFYSLQVMVRARVPVPVARLRDLLRGEHSSMFEGLINRALTIAGDEAGARACLKLARTSGAWQDWEVVRLSGCVALREEIEAFVRESDDYSRTFALEALAELGQEESLGVILEILGNEQFFNSAAQALGALVKRHPGLLQDAVNRFAECTAVGRLPVDEWTRWTLDLRKSGGKAGERDALVAAWLNAAALHTEPATWDRIRGVLRRLVKPPAGTDTFEQWEAWWKQELGNRD